MGALAIYIIWTWFADKFQDFSQGHCVAHSQFILQLHNGLIFAVICPMDNPPTSALASVIGLIYCICYYLLFMTHYLTEIRDSDVSISPNYTQITLHPSVHRCNDKTLITVAHPGVKDDDVFAAMKRSY